MLIGSFIHKMYLFDLNIKRIGGVNKCSVYCYFFKQENPSEEDAAIVDKVLSMRLTKKEVSLFFFY